MTFRCAGGLLNSFPSSIRAPQLHLWQTFAAHRPGVPKLLALQYLSAYSIGVGSGGRHSPSQSSCTGAQAETERNVGRERAFAQVDVFAARPYRGNPVAVVLDGDGLTDTDMARFARWINLGETTYVTTPKSEATDFGLRFFPLTVNFRSRDAPRWGRCTRGSNPAENRGTGTSSCSNAV